MACGGTASSVQPETSPLPSSNAATTVAADPTPATRPAAPAPTATPPARATAPTPAPTPAPAPATLATPVEPTATPISAAVVDNPDPSPTPTAVPGTVESPASTATPPSTPTPVPPTPTPAPPSAPGTQTADAEGVTHFVPLDQPRFVPAAQAQSTTSESVVLGLNWRGEQRAYPLSMMWFHHIANDNVDGWPVLVTY